MDHEEKFGQIRFDIEKHKEAFECWDENQHLYSGKIRFVIDRHPFSEGIWIEDINGQKTGTESIYRTNEQVQKLRKNFN